MNKIIIALGALAFCSAPAFASSDDAWAELFTKVKDGCSAEAKLEDAKMSEPILYPDDVPYVGLVMTGTQTAGTRKIEDVSMLCLFDKKTEKAVVSEYSWAE